jgi:glycine/D-amino acid oxidase-like deaminating enzyme/nitrite reductase/ring-hydroxylating ferredoxin subunit
MRSIHPGESISVWADEVQMPFTPSLTQDILVDVCVVGGGVAGLTTAYFLAREGKSVCVLEDYELGSGQTGRSTGQLVTALDERYFKLEKLHGQEGAALAAESHAAALTQVEQIVRTEHIDCDFSRLDGYLFASPQDDEKILWRELEAAQRAGLNVSLLERVPYKAYDFGPCLHFPRQIQLHPLKYLKGLAECLLRDGGQIYTRSHVADIQGGADCKVKTREGFTVSASHVVVATHAPINNLFAIHTKQAPYRTYVIGARIPKGSFPHGLLWDTHNPYHYIRAGEGLDPTHDLLIVGGEDHKTGENPHPEKCHDRLEGWARLRFPLMEEVVYRWSGQCMEPVDGLAFLGHNPLDRDNIYVITGDSGNGMTHATIGAMIITDQIHGRPNPWAHLYNPSRLSFKAAGTFIRENAKAAGHFADWFSGADLHALETLRNGEGIVLKNALGPIAAFKNEVGSVELKSAVCSHLGCIVAWNGVERSWDCPCHGSRFDSVGQVIEGPATKNLADIDDKDLVLIAQKMGGGGQVATDFSGAAL